MSQLFQPMKIGRLPLRNRTVIAPMCQYSAVDGTPGNWHLIHLGHLALSGADLLIIEATAVSAEGRITSGDLGLYSDANEAGIARVLHAIRDVSPIPVAMQISHAGRKASSPCALGRRPADPRGRAGQLARGGAVGGARRARKFVSPESKKALARSRQALILLIKFGGP